MLLRVPEVLGVDLSVTREVVMVWCAALVTAAVLVPACRRKGLSPRGLYQGTFDALIELIDREVVGESSPHGGRTWAGFLLTLFFFILFCNLLGMLPVRSLGGAITGNVNVSGALALMVFVITLVVGVWKCGVLGFLKKFVPEGVPWWALILAVPVEMISWLMRPVSLTLRLFINMSVGHLLIGTFVAMAAGATLLAPIPFVGAVLMSCFELFVCFIQALIFALLAALYIREATTEGE